MNPTPAQLQAIESSHPKILVPACPGSGKTRALTWRVQHLINTATTPSSIACVTFTQAGAKEMQTRLAKMEIKIGFIGTLHSLMMNLIRQYGAIIGYQGGRFTILDREDEEEFLAEIVAKHRWKGTAKALQEAIAPGPASAAMQLVSTVDIVANGYWQELRRKKLLTFDAILILGERLLRTMADRSAIPFRHWLIDEVQDSSELDFRIYDLLVGDKFLIGDGDQSIFSFRGAVPRLFFERTQDAEWVVIPLEGNFRSGLAICESAQRLIEHNKERFAKKTVSMVDYPSGREFKVLENPCVEASFIGTRISALREASGKPWSEFAVLVATNDLVTEYSNALRAMSIPIARSTPPERPVDWRLAKSVLSHLADPDNDHAAMQCCYLVNGAPATAKLHGTAAMGFCSFNTAWLNIRPVNLDEVSAFRSQLQRLGVLPSTVELILDTRGKLPLGATMADLLVELGREDEQITGEGVIVSTIHAAKGAEYDYVFLAAWEQEIIPSTRKSMDIEDQRRLCYVALTRARRGVVITNSAVRAQKWGASPRPVPTTPSQFIAEMGVGL